MYDTPLLILAFFLIGIPGATWLWLQFRSAQKREQTAYDWSLAEITRRTRLLDEKEQAYVGDRAIIGKLLQEVTRLNTERDRLETMIEEMRFGQDNGEMRQSA
jgi:hypothetical protein